MQGRGRALNFSLLGGATFFCIVRGNKADGQTNLSQLFVALDGGPRCVWCYRALMPPSYYPVGVRISARAYDTRQSWRIKIQLKYAFDYCFYKKNKTFVGLE